ncbi:MAG: hypothetical protein JXJ19_06680 [Elusimicrobia bacterium]|nr:hypothetical protein [Elusimicrobiota bacterium]
MNKMKSFIKILLIAVSAAVFLIYSLKELDLPGLQEDEAIIAVAAFPLWGLRSPANTTSFRVLGRYLPLMYHPYHAAGAGYLISPFLALGGMNVIALRSATVFYGAVTLLFIYLLAKLIDRTGFLPEVVLLLTSTHATYLLTVRKGCWYSSVLLLSAYVGLFLVGKWFSTGKTAYFLSGIFIMGTGMSVNSSYIFFILSSGILFALVYIFKIRKLPGLSAKTVLAGLLFIFLSGILLVWGGFSPGGRLVDTFNNSFVRINFRQSSYPERLRGRIENLYKLTDGTAHQEEEFNNKHNISPHAVEIPAGSVYPMGNGIFPVLWVLGSALCVPPLLKRRRIDNMGILVLFNILFVLVSPFTLSGISINHVIPIFPLSMIICSYLPAGLISRGRVWALIGACVITAAVLRNVSAMNGYFRFIERTGGVRTCSDAVYDLAEWIKQERADDYFLGDWGLRDNLIFLTRGRSYPCYSVPDMSFDDIGEDDFAEYFQDREKYYIFRYGSENIGRFAGIAVKNGKKVVMVRQFLRKDGCPVYNIYRAE